MAETKPAIEQGDLATFQRTYASLPGTQLSYGTRVITKPAISTIPGATAVNGQEVTGAGTRTNLGTIYTYSDHVFAQNRVYGPQVALSGVDSGSDFRVTWATHGLAGTERIGILCTDGVISSWHFFTSSQYSVIDTNTIDLLGWSSLSSATYGAEFLAKYTPGTDRIGIRFSQRFYLPGVSPGITTPTDIPKPALLLNDEELIIALLAYQSGYQTYDASELTRWDGGPIYTQTYQELDMATL
jgi:hypothetical protein